VTQPVQVGHFSAINWVTFKLTFIRSRGMLFYRLLELAVAHEPVRYEDIVASRRPRKTPPVAPERRGHPASLERPAANRPWRATG
jgi:hypothetical protein